MGSRVVVLEMADRLLSSEEPEISMLVEKTLKKVADIHTSEKIEKIEKSKSGWNVATSSVQSGAKNNFDASHVLLALGRRSNTDLLDIANTASGSMIKVMLSLINIWKQINPASMRLAI